MVLRRLAGLVLAACTLFAVPVRAEGPRELVVGVEELDYFPAYAVQKGEYVGAAREIFDAFAQAKGYALTYRPLPVKRLYAELLSGGIDFKFPDNPGWGADLRRDAQVAYSRPVIAYVDGVMVRPENKGKGADRILTLGTVSGFTPFAWLDRVRDQKVVLKENPRTDLLIRQVAVGRIDGAYASVAVVHYSLEHELNMPGALVFDPALPHSRDAYRLSTVNHPAALAEFDAWMAANQAQVDAIKQRYGAEKGLN